MTKLGLDACRAAFLDQNAQLAELVEKADPEVPVPSCPGWDLHKLTAHVGRGDRWAATMVTTRATEPVDPRTVADGRQPADPPGAARWLRDGAAMLLRAVDEVGPDAPVWTFTGPRTAGWWVRRRAHEVIAHRADAALALGLAFEVGGALGADAVSEWLDLLVSRGGGVPSEALPEGTTLHLHATDEGLGDDGEWVLRRGEAGISWQHGHQKATTAVRGSAADLFVALLGRVPAGHPGLAVHGDPTLFAGFVAATPF
jgi:uncharacterized protein (TIGR03083 family)